MYPANAFVIRLAGDFDDYDLYRLAVLDEQEPLEHPILIGEIDGEPAAAMSLEDRRTIANPFMRTDLLRSHLRLRAAAFDAAARRPAVADRIRHALQPRYA